MSRRNRSATRAVPLRRCARCRRELTDTDVILCRRCAAIEDHEAEQEQADRRLAP